MHDLVISVSESNGSERKPISVTLDKGTPRSIHKNEHFDIHINSENDNIRSHRLEVTNGVFSLRTDDPIVDYGQQFCKSKIILLGNGG